jgi:hypothetical protein
VLKLDDRPQDLEVLFPMISTLDELRWPGKLDCGDALQTCGIKCLSVATCAEARGDLMMFRADPLMPSPLCSRCLTPTAAAGWQ